MLRTAGTFAVSEREYNVYLHKLLPGPLLELQQIAKLPCPEPATEHKENHSAAATWAPDESSVLLRYTICDYLDERGQWNANQWFEVGPLLPSRAPHCRLLHSLLLSNLNARLTSCPEPPPLTQVLYLLDIATQEFRLVTTTYDILTMSAVRYFLGGHMIVFWVSHFSLQSTQPGCNTVGMLCKGMCTRCTQPPDLLPR